MPSRSLRSTRSIILAPLVLLTACAAPEGPDAPLGDVADAALARANDADLMSPDALEWLDDAIAERLGEALELRLEQQRIDPLGMHHARLSQAVDGIPVFAAAAVVHADAAGALRGITDGLLRDLDVDTTPRLSASQAVAQAVAGTDGPAPTEPPRAELMILRHEGEDHLAYRVEVRQLGLHPEPASWVVFVDAHDGHEVWRYDDLHRWALQSSLQTTWDAHGTTKLATATV
ncbi:MAG: PepSY domain-containing protein, partial [Myxococcales bacterium]|nr:PepSY domain-containing protein [Myxococcales bacterium]